MNLIEMVGVSGSGKTTLMPLVKNKLSKYIIIYDINDLMIQFFVSKSKINQWLMLVLPNKFKKKVARKYYTLFNFKYFFQTEFIKNNSKLIKKFIQINYARKIPIAEKKMIMGWFLTTCGIYSLAETILDKESYLIIDEGFVHKVTNLFVSFGENSFNQKKLIEYLELIPKIEYLFYIQRDLSKFIGARDKYRTERLKNKTKDEVCFFIKKNQNVIIATLDIIKRRNIIIEIDNNNHISNKAIDELIKPISIVKTKNKVV